MKSITYFYEGETEKALLNFLKHTDNNKIRPGKVKKFNLWQDKIGTILRKLSKKTELYYFIIDTDTVTNIQLFEDNLKKLKGYNVCLIVQNENLEDELSYMCAQTEKQLFAEFSACNKDEFTRKFIQANLSGKLKNCDLNKLWSRGNSFLQKNNIKNSKNCQYKL